jgi:hypothetical protein
MTGFLFDFMEMIFMFCISSCLFCFIIFVMGYWCRLLLINEYTTYNNFLSQNIYSNSNNNYENTDRVEFGQYVDIF